MQRKFIKKGLSKSSKEWIKRKETDHYVEKSKSDGYRSRSAFKLLEIDEKFNLLKPGKLVVDFGCAPGGWCQVALNKVGPNCVIGFDLLEVDGIAEVKLYRMDVFAQIEEVKKIILNEFGRKCDVVLSDMAPNTCGDPLIDHLRITNLIESALYSSNEILADGGSFVAKTFRGRDDQELFKSFREHFESVKYFKPLSSRSESREIYIVGTQKKKSM